MLKIMNQIQNMDSRIKWFLFNAVLYGLLMLATTVYVYARLDYVRTGVQNEKTTDQGSSNK